MSMTNHHIADQHNFYFLKTNLWNTQFYQKKFAVFLPNTALINDYVADKKKYILFVNDLQNIFIKNTVFKKFKIISLLMHRIHAFLKLNDKISFLFEAYYKRKRTLCDWLIKFTFSDDQFTNKTTEYAIQ